MNELTSILETATQRIEGLYFRLPIEKGMPVYRERVYCYELYHQLRCLWPATTRFYLNGEVDKAAHPVLRRLGVNRATPDLLVHRPGFMTGNYAIIEVKSTDAPRRGIEKDLETLKEFRQAVGYERAIYLLFGDSIERTLDHVRRIASSIEDLPPIEMWLHGRPGQRAAHSLL